jgi:hypothetical protein
MIAPASKRYTEAELIEFENAFEPDEPIIRELTDYIRATVGVQAIPPQKPPRPDERKFWRAFDLRKQKAAKQAAIQKAIALLEGPGDIPLPGYNREIIPPVPH